MFLSIPYLYRAVIVSSSVFPSQNVEYVTPGAMSFLLDHPMTILLYQIHIDLGHGSHAFILSSSWVPYSDISAWYIGIYCSVILFRRSES